MLNSRRPRIRPEQKITPKDFCGGTAQLDSKTTVPSRGQRVVFLTRRRTKHANIAQGKPQAGASHPSGTLGKKTTVRSYDIAVAAPRRLPKFSKLQYHKFARNISPESRSPLRLFARAPHLSGHGRIAWLLPRASPVAPAYAPSRARYAISCRPISSWSSSTYHNTPSTNQLHVFSFQVGRSVLLRQGLLFQHFFFLFQKFSARRVGTLGIYSLLITNQQQLVVWIPLNFFLLHSKHSKPFRGS